jgi:hypothetical protein
MSSKLIKKNGPINFSSQFTLKYQNVSPPFFCTITFKGPPQVSHWGGAVGKAATGNCIQKIFVKRIETEGQILNRGCI